MQCWTISIVSNSTTLVYRVMLIYTLHSVNSTYAFWQLSHFSLDFDSSQSCICVWIFKSRHKPTTNTALSLYLSVEQKHSELRINIFPLLDVDLGNASNAGMKAAKISFAYKHNCTSGHKERYLGEEFLEMISITSQCRRNLPIRSQDVLT